MPTDDPRVADSPPEKTETWGDTVKVKQFSRNFFHVKNPAGVFSAVMLPQAAKFRNGING
jgi:hypothetical protein